MLIVICYYSYLDYEGVFELPGGREYEERSTAPGRLREGNQEAVRIRGSFHSFIHLFIYLIFVFFLS